MPPMPPMVPIAPSAPPPPPCFKVFAGTTCEAQGLQRITSANECTQAIQFNNNAIGKAGYGAPSSVSYSFMAGGCLTQCYSGYTGFFCGYYNALSTSNVVSGNSRVHCTCRPISALDKLASKLSALEAPDVVPKPHANRRSSHPSRPSTANILQPVAAGTATGVAAISIAGQVDAERESVQQVNKHLERRAAAMELEAKRQARLMQPLKKAAQKETPPTDDPHLCPDSDPDCMQPELLRRRAV